LRERANAVRQGASDAREEDGLGTRDRSNRGPL
jgi:hypothetical protein